MAAAALAWVFAPSMVIFAQRWSDDPGASHGPLIPVIAALLLWAKREQLARLPRRASLAGLGLLAVGLMLQALASWADVLFLLPLALVVGVWGLVVYLYGRQVARAAVFPLSFLLFAVPWPDFLVEAVSFPLQIWTSTYSAMAAGMLGVPVVRDGVQLNVGTFALTVAAPCSGIRSLVALMAIAAVFAYLLPAPMPRRVALFAAGIPVALVANTVRVTAILLMAKQFGTKIALGFFHDYSSPFLFVLACLVLMGLWKALECRPGALEEPRDRDAARAVPVKSGSAGRTPRFAIVLMLALMAKAVISFGQTGWKAGAHTVELKRVPSAVASWRATDHGLDADSRKLLTPDAYLWRSYRSQREIPLDLLVIYGHTKNSFHSPGQCLPGSGWLVTEKRLIDFDYGAGRLPMMLFHIQKGRARQLVLFSFMAGEASTASLYRHNWNLLVDRVLHRANGGALVRLIVPMVGTEQESLEIAARFARGAFPPLREELAGKRPGG